MPADPEAGTKALSEAKRRLLEARLRGSAAAAPGPDIATRPAEGPVPATRLQEAMWVLGRLASDPATYNIHFGLDLQGALDAEVMIRAVAAVASRHESLRCGFENRDGRLFLREGPEDAGVGDSDRIEVIDVEHEPDPDRAATDAAVAFARRRFDLDAPPLWRAALIRRSTTSHLLMFVVHHVVCDERSLDLLVDDIADHYRRFVEGRQGAPRPTRDYGDYACWQAEWLERNRADQLAYWREQLAGSSGRLELPTDYPRGARQSFAGALLEHELGGQLAARVTDLARDRGATPFMLLLAGFNILLDRYTGECDIVVGTPVSLRGPTPTGDMVGLFINALALRSRVDHAGDFTSYLADTRHQFLAALEHKELPFEDLVSELVPRRAASHNPVFQVMLVLETEPVPSRLPGLELSLRRFDTGTAKFDLTVFVRLSPTGLRLTAEYNTALFESTSVDALLAAYGTVLNTITSTPELTIAGVGLVGNDDLSDWQADACGEDLDLGDLPTVTQQIVTVAVTAAQTPAVVLGDTRSSYADFAAAAAGLAASLDDAGHDGTAPIAVLLPRSVRFATAVFGVLRAGAAYVPLDIAAPDRRLGRLLGELKRNAGGEPVLVVCDDADRQRVTTLGGTPIVFPTAPAAASFAPRHAAADDLAYVIYTSGSTGRPKGVAVAHANLAASNEARRVFYRRSPERFLLVSPFHFDSSIAGLFWTLTGGGTLVLPDPELAADPRHLATIIARERVTDILLLPSLHALLLTAAAPGQLDTLQTVIVAGEALTADVVAAHDDALPGAALVNEYGPTEATVWATAGRCRPDRRPPSIGRAIANARAYVVDADLNPAAVGAAGELCIGGAGVAAGYLQQPELTAAAFIADPFETGGRIYRTGDRVRRRDDGNLDYLGRLDGQLKIRGYRIEPAEIEAALGSLAWVEEAAVVARSPAGDAGTWLVAWCVAADTAPAADEIRAALGQTLPEYMVPQVIRFAHALPRTATGKLDRRALADLPVEETDRPAAAAGELTRMEQRLAGLWRSLLGVETLHRDSNFFDLGGHSLLGVTLMLGIEREFNCALPLSVLFESPTLGGLTLRIAGTDRDGRPLDYLNPVRTTGDAPPLFVVQGEVRELARRVGPDQPIYLAYRSLDSESFQRMDVEEHAGKILEEIRRVRPHGPYRLCGFSFGGQVALEIARLVKRAGDEVELLALIDPPSTEDSSYARLQVQRQLARVRATGGAAARFAFVLRQAPAAAWRLLRRRWDRVRIRQLEKRGKPLPFRLVMERDRANYIRTSAGYRYRNYDGDVVLIVPEGVEGLGERTVAAWHGLVAGQLYARILPGARVHADLLASPWREDVAGYLNDALIDPALIDPPLIDSGRVAAANTAAPEATPPAPPEQPAGA